MNQRLSKKNVPVGTISAKSKFPLLAECFKFSDSSPGLFPLLKDWDQASDEAYGELAVKAEWFLSKSNSKALDHARLEVSLILSEIAAVALFFTDRKDVHA